MSVVSMSVSSSSLVRFATRRGCSGLVRAGASAYRRYGIIPNYRFPISIEARVSTKPCATYADKLKLDASTKSFDVDDVLDRAVDLFWVNGYAATSMEDLVNHLDINQGSLYSTFGSKPGIVPAGHRALCERRRDWMAAIVSDPAIPLRDTIDTILTSSAETTDHRRCLLVTPQSSATPPTAISRSDIEGTRRAARTILAAAFRSRRDGWPAVSHPIRPPTSCSWPRRGCGRGHDRSDRRRLHHPDQCSTRFTPKPASTPVTKAGPGQRSGARQTAKRPTSGVPSAASKRSRSITKPKSAPAGPDRHPRRVSGPARSRIGHVRCDASRPWRRIVPSISRRFVGGRRATRR